VTLAARHADHLRTPSPLAPWGQGSVSSGYWARQSADSTCGIRVALPSGELIGEHGVRHDSHVSLAMARERKQSAKKSRLRK
jgi:hypothetical protein